VAAAAATKQRTKSVPLSAASIRTNLRAGDAVGFASDSPCRSERIKRFSNAAVQLPLTREEAPAKRVLSRQKERYMPELIAKKVHIEVRHVHFHSIITVTIGPCKWIRKLPGRYTDHQAARLWHTNA